MKSILNPNNIIFAGIYSDKYHHYYNNLYKFLSKYFPSNNIIYTKINQQIFDNHTNYGKQKCYWCQKNICRFVFHKGETCKIENQITIYEQFLNTPNIIIYTDCDIIFNNTIIEELTSIINHHNYQNTDIFYRSEANKRRWRAGINIGLTLSRSNDKILEFYKSVLRFMQTNQYPHTWDQQVINNMFANKTTQLKYGIFPNHVLCKHKLAGGLG